MSLLRGGALAQAAYFVPVDPSSGEQNEYNRHPTLYLFKSRAITWSWAYSYGAFPLGWQPPVAGDYPPVRMLVDGRPVSDWVKPTANKYTFKVELPDGHHLVDFEGVPAGVEVMRKGFTVNASGSPLPVQRPWTSRTRFESSYGTVGFGAEQTAYPGELPSPTAWKLKPRVVEPFSERLTKKQLWTRRIQTHINTGMMRRFVDLPTGDKDPRSTRNISTATS